MVWSGQVLSPKDRRARMRCLQFRGAVTNHANRFINPRVVGLHAKIMRIRTMNLAKRPRQVSPTDASK